MSNATRIVQWVTLFLSLLAIQCSLARIERLLTESLRDAKVIEVRP